MIGYYVHHHGRGHLARATSICAHLRSPVTLLSSLAMPEHPDHVRLPRDDAGVTWSDPTAHGALHWAPLHHDGFRERMRLITEWVMTARPDAVVVDVSVEVAMLVRLLGVPTVVVAMPGDRTDPAHELAYRTADHILAAWPKSLYEPPWLRQHEAKTTYVGGISRFDGRPRIAAPSDGRDDVLVLSGAGGSDLDQRTVNDCAAAHPQYRWTPLGVKGGPWADDPWPALCSADVVITSAGQSSVADIAAAERPAVVIAAQRPFAEQRATAWALERGGLAVVQHGLPTVDEWPALIDRARARGSDGWQRWATRGAAARAARAIERVASVRAAGVTA
jgi:UDP-N-acetylglucosamine--N-acetylmuramyl-(pentapeptide) pyrophosphoryl-undecaprenol N-acetylglucosamine transferase